MMKRLLKDLLKMMLVFGGLCLLFTVKAHAGVEDYEYPHYKGNANAGVFVREGPGTEYDKLTDASGAELMLSQGEEVEILEERKSNKDATWYHIAFTRKDVQYIGFSHGDYISKDDQNPITPTPTPTPEITEPPVVEDPTEKANPAAKTDTENKDTDINEDEVAAEDEESENEGGNMLWTVVWVLLIVCVILFLLFVGLNYLRHRAQNQQPAPARRVERFKQMNNQNKEAGRKVPQIRTAGTKHAAPPEPRREVYVKRREPAPENFVPASQVDLEQDNEDKRILREKIEQLQEHDLVRHVVYGEGEVYDNSDVKLLEVRFGNDMRFLKKDQLVNKRELVVFDDEDQSIAKRRRRRINNQSNRNY